MKVYTRGGDKGRTSLFTGARVEKDDPRIEALGSIDELVAVLGIAKASSGSGDDGKAVRTRIEALQSQLYLVMADLASDAAADAEARLPADAAAGIEAMIDTLDADLPALTDFVIPGASPISAALHHARTVCRRAERRVRSAASEHDLPPSVTIYLNRLSDLLFVLARWVDREAPGAGRTFRETL